MARPAPRPHIGPYPCGLCGPRASRPAAGRCLRTTLKPAGLVPSYLRHNPSTAAASIAKRDAAFRRASLCSRLAQDYVCFPRLRAGGNRYVGLRPLVLQSIGSHRHRVADACGMSANAVAMQSDRSQRHRHFPRPITSCLFSRIDLGRVRSGAIHGGGSAIDPMARSAASDRSQPRRLWHLPRFFGGRPCPPARPDPGHRFLRFNDGRSHCGGATWRSICHVALRRLSAAPQQESSMINPLAVGALGNFSVAAA